MSGLTCIACRVAFVDPDIQRAHYKTDWHRYNLKRKVADMPPVTAENFTQRVLSQQAQTKDLEKQQASHCMVCGKHFSTQNAYQNHLQSKKHKEAESKAENQDHDANVVKKNAKNTALKKKSGNLPAKTGESEAGSSVTEDMEQAGASVTEDMEQAGASVMEDMEQPGCSASGSSAVVASSPDMADDDDSDAESWESWEGDALGIEDCLFCCRVFNSMEKNVEHMTTFHSFFIPDVEYVSNLEGLLTYLGEKVGEGHICLWCNEKSKAFRSTKSVQQHMVDKGHCLMLHQGDTIFEYADFYDYRSSYPDQVGKVDDEVDDEVDDDNLYEGNFELVLPSGSVIGHRSLQRYFRQKLRPDKQLALRKPSRLSHLMAHYKALGWQGSTVDHMLQKKARDISSFKRLQNRHHMRVGVKANKLQKHYRHQILGC